jgi:hypothetical protein
MNVGTTVYQATSRSLAEHSREIDTLPPSTQPQTSQPQQAVAMQRF